MTNLQSIEELQKLSIADLWALRRYVQVEGFAAGTREKYLVRNKYVIDLIQNELDRRLNLIMPVK